MPDFTKIIEERLSAEDRKLLGDIFAPAVVGVPDGDPGFGSLTVTRDGKIRAYGAYNCKNIFTPPESRSYLESCDGGLSWKRHLVSREAMGCGTYIPFLDKYLAVRWPRGENGKVLLGTDPDDENPEVIDLGFPLQQSTSILPLRTRDRVLILDHEHRPERHRTAYFPILLLTDDGRHYRRISLPEVPFAEKEWPHKGYRWQQNNRECTVCELSDGRILLYSRTATDYHYTAISEDGGETFSPFIPSAFHSTGTMPRLLRLSDGRILFFFCNTQLLPELPEADGIWEDFFTNRDVCHAAISEDEGKTFFGLREVMLNPWRTRTDFRSLGGPEEECDKSVHQFEAIELPLGKVLLVAGQNRVCRRMLIFDVKWLYETDRKEDFIHGLLSLSTQTYVRSIPGCYKGKTPETALSYTGHCAYNRVDSARLLPSPRNDFREVLSLRTREDDEDLAYPLSGAVWNFPAAKKGTVHLSAMPSPSGLRVSLLDTWRNPCDETVEYLADASVVIPAPAKTPDGFFTDFDVSFDCEEGTYSVVSGEKTVAKGTLRFAHPYGLCYLHLQSLPGENKPSLIAGFSFKRK